jgi:hypothetical protein
MRALPLLAALLLFAPDLYAQCQDTLVGDEPVVTNVINKDASTLSLTVRRCETEISIESGGISKILATLQGGSGYSRLVDLNGDGFHEIDFVAGCGVINCSHTIYVLAPETHAPRKLLSYSGVGLKRIDGYFFASSRQGADEYWIDGYRILEFDRPNVAPNPTVHILNGYDERTGQQVCRISLSAQDGKSAFAKKIVNAFCFPKSKVRYGWRQ